ncbi:MAG: hypothetical protein IPL46_20340 [Saprospiraceae bacterium]|nr:hypothetical protein [Saprospiraceae bacterium]
MKILLILLICLTTLTPTKGQYILDVEHTGVNGGMGIRSKSTASYSVVDIDAFNGDAALRFYREGIGKWNIRNNPSTDAYQIFQLGAGVERMRIDADGQVFIPSNLIVSGTVVKGGGAFKIDHPLDPANKYLMHSFRKAPT